MLIEKLAGVNNPMSGKTVLLTGGGGGIGFEAAKAFAYMGARVVIAEIDRSTGEQAEGFINHLFEEPLAMFYRVDLSDDLQVYQLIEYIIENYGCPDVIFNNATITKIGGIDEISPEFWDQSYQVNFKAPLILLQKFLPLMKEQNHGTIVFVSSSGAAPFMGAYEVFKTAQVELCNTLAMELEGTDINTYTIGPGLVKTQTAMEAIEIVAGKMGMSTQTFYQMNDRHIIDIESAGTGFALSALKAKTYNGQEISSLQVLMDFELMGKQEMQAASLKEELTKESAIIMEKILLTYTEQYKAWKGMNIFERQWVLRDFKKSMSLSGEQALEKLKNLNNEMKKGNAQLLLEEKVFFEKLMAYWKHQLKLLQSYEKDRKKLEENTLIIKGWIQDIEKMLSLLVS